MLQFFLKKTLLKKVNLILLTSKKSHNFRTYAPVREESPFYSNCRAIFNDNFIWHNRDDYDVDIMKGVIDS